jgi:hypothetical protein
MARLWAGMMVFRCHGVNTFFFLQRILTWMSTFLVLLSLKLHALRSCSMVKSVSGECHGSRDMRTGNGGSSLCGKVELAWWLMTRSSGFESGATSQERSKVLPCRVKIQGLALVDCTWQWPCWRHCFVSGDFLQGENLRSVIGRWRCVCTVSFLKALLLKKLEFWCCLGGVSAAVTRN